MKRIAGYAVLALLAACRPEPGDSDYENQGPVTPPGGGTDPDPDVLPGPFPYEAGQRRLGVGFYEGGRSDDIPVDNSTTFVYLYEGTATMEPSSTRVEGKSADLVVHAGKAWLGFGVHWNTPRNLNTWKRLHVSLRSSDPGFAVVEVAMSDDVKDVKINVEKYGYVNDGAWHHLSIPLTDFTTGGLKLGVIDAPFVLLAGGGAPADKLLLDNLYFTAE
ncbi:hypothetical protein ACN28I_19665 [Archangium gephyra]|uniref:hypothetical protein n=1 Tax=Archangium gephyra TaxID=48 RepID=UPI003B7A9448